MRSAQLQDFNLVDTWSGEDTPKGIDNLVEDEAS